MYFLKCIFKNLFLKIMDTTTTSIFRKKPDYYSSESECILKEREFLQTNSRYKDFDQTHFTAGDIDQFEEYRNKTVNSINNTIDLSKNIFNNLSYTFWSKFKNLNVSSVDNTFNYLFYKFKKGIFVKIQNGKLDVFLPFSNRNFVNEWSHKIHIDPKFGNLLEFIKHVQLSGGHKFFSNGVNKQLDTWYSNNCLVRYEYPLKERDTNISIISDSSEKVFKENL
jgi:hypothetical protein